MLNKNDIEKARLFLQSLEGQKIRADETALLVIDVQRFFCDPGLGFINASEESAQVAKKIQSIVPAFRKAGVAVYPIRTALPEHYSDFIRQGGEDFYLFQPANDEKTRWKKKSSAFEDTPLYGTLVNAGKKNLLLCGVYFEACVRTTAIDAADFGRPHKQTFNVAVMADLTACRKTTRKEETKRTTLSLMDIKKIPALSSKAVLKALKA